MTLPLLFADIPQVFAEFYDPERPWELLGEPLDTVLASITKQVVLGRNSVFETGATIKTPAYIGEGCVIGPGAVIHGGCWIGDGCVIGPNTEIKRSIMLPGSKAPHLNYVGDSILGADVNIGAGVKLANFRHDGDEVGVAVEGGLIATGRRKLGALLGDKVTLGCNSVTNPGCVVGTGTRIYAGAVLAGTYPADSVLKLRQEIEVLPQRGQTPLF